MLKIVIVEDEQKVANQLQSFLQKYANVHQLEFQIEYFDNPENFLKDYDNETNLVFMDINMPQMNGMNVAKKLRKLDSKVSLIFVTSLAKYAINGYEVQAMDFILKPVNYETFSMKLNHIMKMIDVNADKKILVKTVEGVVTVYIRDIQYIEIADHYLYFHVKKEILKARGTLKEVQKTLEGEPFSLCNKCYLVNLASVDSIIDNMIIIDDQELLLSRLRKKDFMIRLADYYGNRKVNMGKLQ